MEPRQIAQLLPVVSGCFLWVASPFVRSATGTQNLLCPPAFQCSVWQLVPQYHTSLQREHETSLTPSRSPRTQQFAHSLQGNNSFLAPAIAIYLPDSCFGDMASAAGRGLGAENQVLEAGYRYRLKRKASDRDRRCVSCLHLPQCRGLARRPYSGRLSEVAPSRMRSLPGTYFASFFFAAGETFPAKPAFRRFTAGGGELNGISVHQFEGMGALCVRMSFASG